MQLEQQVTSPELSRKLEELGVKQESLFYWSQEHKVGEPYNRRGWGVQYRSKTVKINGDEVDWYAAFTVAELGEMLPGRAKWDIKDKWSNDWICREYIVPSLNGRSYVMNYEGDNHSLLDGKDIIDDHNEANARAKMLIYLLENKLITA